MVLPFPEGEEKEMGSGAIDLNETPRNKEGIIVLVNGYSIRPHKQF